MVRYIFHLSLIFSRNIFVIDLNQSAADMYCRIGLQLNSFEKFDSNNILEAIKERNEDDD